ncbi:hypothetical protein BPAE_0036g00100 [Botrytis paeoniae]|uniref:Uncharacterized protein n=1 Tax=Botrytis paeoniae TaxID=278948 RepID=A0A4Z1FY31_9HELO|nr:hypothetical protein BPAE_0036g00100 [Botrytis paeoniae]
MVWKIKEQRKDDDDTREEIWCAKLSYPTYQPIYTRRDGVLWCYRHSFKPLCECPECVQQFRSMGSQIKKVFTYSFALSDVEARQKSEGFVRSIDENLAYLQEQCNNNGNAIMKKWKKKSREKREGLLRSVDPDLYPHQWFYAHFNQSFLDTMVKKLSINGEIDTDFTQGKQLRKHRTSCLLPYLNVEGLSQDPMRLLGLLYNRTKYSPEQWAPFDNSLLEKHWAIGSLALDYNSHSIILYGPKYGTMTQ